MRIGLIDVDGHRYPNLPLMKLSAWHKAKGDTVEWYEPLFHTIGEPFDLVYMSKVFSFTPDYPYGINCKKLVRGGSGYAIELTDGKEFYHKEKDTDLPYEIEHIYPDYSMYPEHTKDTAFGFLTRGCPRACHLCHVSSKEGRLSRKVADLSEFWRGQKHIEILDPNTLACKEWEPCLQQLIDSKSRINFNQGLDIRATNDHKNEMLSQIKIDEIHFAWDRYEDKEIICPKFDAFRKISKVHPHDLQVYVITGDRDRRIRDEDLYRIYWLRDHGYAPYVTIYDKANLPRNHELIKLQRWVNNRWVFWKVPTFEEYKKEGWKDA